MFFRSIRFRLTLWYALPMAAFLAAIGFFGHLYLSGSLLRSIDEKLYLVTEDLKYFYQVLAPPQENLCTAVNEFIGRHSWNGWVQVLDGNGELICVSPNLDSYRLPMSPKALQHARHKHPYLESVGAPGPHPLRLLTYPVPGDGDHPDMIIQAGVRQVALERTLADLRLTFYIFSPIVLSLLSLGGWILAGRALSPMVRMSRAARRITAENLSLRLPVEPNGDEISVLAENFNSMLARLETSFRRIRQFSGDASHELRTPLAILRGETEVTLRWARSVDDYRRTLESNLEEITRMGRIIDDLLTLAKSDAGELPLEITDLSLSDLLQELYLQGKTLGESKQTEVNLHLDVAEEIRIRGDELRLRQIFLNLISNGIKYTPPGGRVEITLSLRDEEAVVQVADSGIGIPPEHLPHIFDRFYRVDKARNRADGGTGLGLAISKSIVEAHAGRLAVESTPEEGSTFIVFLPVQGPSENHRQKASAGPYCYMPDSEMAR